MNRRDITKLLTKALEESINPNFDPQIYYVKEVTQQVTGKLIYSIALKGEHSNE